MLYETISTIYHLLNHDPTIPKEQSFKLVDYLSKQDTIYQEVVTLKEVREILNVSRKTLMSYIQSGSLKPVNRLSKKILFDQDEVQSFAEEKAMKGMDEKTDSPRKGRSKLRGGKQAPKAITSDERKEGD